MATRPKTSANAVEDVHKALTAAGIKPPYLLVGNSLGGENVQVFTYRFPAKVKGLVLVERQTEDQTARMDNITGSKITQFYAMVKQQDAWCLDEASKGFKAGTEAQANCIVDPGQPTCHSRRLACDSGRAASCRRAGGPGSARANQVA